jgi:hypothetical protein
MMCDGSGPNRRFPVVQPAGKPLICGKTRTARGNIARPTVEPRAAANIGCNVIELSEMMTKDRRNFGTFQSLIVAAGAGNE